MVKNGDTWAVGALPGLDMMLLQIHFGLKTGGVLSSQQNKPGQSQMAELGRGLWKVDLASFIFNEDKFP